MATKKTTSTSKTKTAKKASTKKPAVKSAPKVSKSTKPKTVHATEPYHPVFGVILLTICVIVVVALLVALTKSIASRLTSDAKRFSSEYSLVEEDNVFVFKTAEEIKNILEHGTGVVFLGFPSCPWCQSYAKMLNDLAKEKGIEEIYYYNIHDDREENTEFYQKLVAILDDYLQYDNEGEKRIYVPETAFVIDGKIVGNDLETSKDTLNLKTPDEYWTEERVATWREKVGKLMDELKSAEGCETTCNE